MSIRNSAAIMMGALLASFFVHELGEIIMMFLFKIPFIPIWEPRPVGGTAPFEVCIIILISGGALSTVIFGLLGRFWRIECYLAALLQALITPFQLFSWFVGVQTVGVQPDLWLFFTTLIVALVIILPLVYVVVGRIFERYHIGHSCSLK